MDTKKKAPMKVLFKIYFLFSFLTSITSLNSNGFAGTMEVQISGKPRWETVAIQDLKPGMEVRGFNVEKGHLDLATVHKVVPRKISSYVEIILYNGEQIIADPEQCLYAKVNDEDEWRWIAAQYLTDIWHLSSYVHRTLLGIKSVRRVNEEITVYNIFLNYPYTFFVEPHETENCPSILAQSSSYPFPCRIL